MVVYGDFYVGYVFIDNMECVSGMIDWSEVCVDDFVIDMVVYFMVFGEEGFVKFFFMYEVVGGWVWLWFVYYIVECFVFGVVIYVFFVFDLGNEEYFVVVKV